PMLFFRGQKLRSRIGSRQIPLRVPQHVTRLSPFFPTVTVREEAISKRQPQRSRNNHKFRRLDAEIAPNNVVGEFVVLRSANAVDEEIGHAEAQEHGGGEGAGGNSKSP